MRIPSVNESGNSVRKDMFYQHCASTADKDHRA
jgi:hypothetical protein